MQKFDKKTLIYGAGAGLGVIQTVASREWGICPLIGGYLPPNWNRSGVIGNIIFGTLVLGISQYTKLFKKHTYIKGALTVYGMAIIAGGFVNALVPSSIPSAGQGMALRRTAGNGVYTASYYPGFQGNFYRRPQSPARGFGSDVTRNPMAMIPTTVPYNQIVS